MKYRKTSPNGYVCNKLLLENPNYVLTRGSEQNDEIRRQSSERFAIYRRCKVEDIDLPLESGSLADVPLDEVSTEDGLIPFAASTEVILL